VVAGEVVGGSIIRERKLPAHPKRTESERQDDHVHAPARESARQALRRY
jgi:hypothetical protein